MALFPTTIKPCYPVRRSPEWNTIITPMRSGKENRSQVVVFPKYKIVLKFDSLNETDANSIINFFNNTARGALNAFRFKWPAGRAYVKEYVGRGDAATTTFNLPCIGGSSGTTTVYVNGVETSVTFSSGTGADGLDQIIFNPAPAAGATITASFTGYWTPQVRFEDSLDEEAFCYLLYRFGQIILIGVPL